jgi:hypothetical protein
LIVVGVTCTLIALLTERAAIEVLSFMRAARKLLICGFANASITQYNRDRPVSQTTQLRIIGSKILATLI